MQNSQTYFLCQSLSWSVSPRPFVSSRYLLYMSSSISLLSLFQPLSLSPYQLHSTPASLTLPLFVTFSLSLLRSLPVYFYISYVVLLIRNLTYTASSCLSASQKLLSPALICRLAGCFSNSRQASIIRTTVTLRVTVFEAIKLQTYKQNILYIIMYNTWRKTCACSSMCSSYICSDTLHCRLVQWCR